MKNSELTKEIKTKISQSINLLNKFSSDYDFKSNELPYRLNLLDDLSTNENAHSKFLIRLLQYKPALIHFIKFIKKDKSNNFTFDVNCIKKPILTYEKFRIDGLIREESKYAIIIENKIHKANEQVEQIGRYIKKCESIGYRVEQIFIVYLTRTEGDNHSEQSWGKEYSSAKFNKRYSKLSYEKKILPWLSNYLKALSLKEELIKSAVVQYIDHLKHFFNKKQIYSKMDSELQNFLKLELKLNTDDKKDSEKIEVIQQKISEISNLKEHLDKLARVTKTNLFRDWENNLINNLEFTEYIKFHHSEDSKINTGITIDYEGKEFSILIEHNYKTIYYGFHKGYGEIKNFETEIKDFLAPIIKRENLKVEEPDWYGWKYTSFSDGYVELENLIGIIIKEKISTSK